MKLRQWLTDNKCSIPQLAEKVGVARFTLQRYLNKGRLPPPAVMAEIYRATKGAVAPNDFYTLRLSKPRKAKRK